MSFAINDWLKVIGGLAAFAPIPHAALAGKLASIVAELIDAEKARSNKTTEEILEAAGLQQDVTAALIDAELARLSALDTQPLSE
jgi:hypothetical protein